MSKKLLRIHGNCKWYHWLDVHNRTGGCSGFGLVDLSKMNLHPLDNACEHFEQKDR